MHRESWTITHCARLLASCETYPLKNHPYFWAGFVLNGANHAVYPVNYGFAFFMAVGLLTILFLWYYRKLI